MFSQSRTSLLALAICLASAGALASGCGPSTPEPTTPGGGEEGGEEGGEASGEEGPGETDVGTTEGGEAGPAPAPVMPEQSVEVTKSQLLADVKKLGIDMKKPPKLETIELGTKKKIMPLFQKALGYEACTGCHVEGDYKKETRNIQMARNMWNEYVAKLNHADGTPLFCDSCHNGKQLLLAREDKDALQKFMETNYEGKLALAEGEGHSCSTCHGDAFETKIFEKMWNVKGE